MSMVRVTGGVDTHADVHVAAAIDHNGGVLGIESFGVDRAGYENLAGWLAGFGPVIRVGVEGTGSYGVGLARFVVAADVEVVEVDRPNRQIRRKYGKSDPTDAVSAARAALSGAASGIPKTRNGPVEQMRVLLVARRSARQQRIQTLNQLRHLVLTAPDEIRVRFKDRYKTGLVTEAAAMRPRNPDDLLIGTQQLRQLPGVHDRRNLRVPPVIVNLPGHVSSLPVSSGCSSSSRSVLVTGDMVAITSSRKNRNC